ncbi:hypothetical protein D3C86_1820350 [compost metagenome]
MEVLNPKHFIADGLCIHRVIFLKLTSDHQLNQSRLVGSFYVHGLYVLSVPQYGYPVSHREDFS